MKTTFLVLASVFFLLNSGCGLKFSKDKTPREEAERALSNKDYATAITKAQIVLDDPSASEGDKQGAYLVLGKALLGKNNATPDEVKAAIEAGQTAHRNFFEVVPSWDTSDTAADAFNTAEEMGAERSTEPSTINSTAQLNRMTANLTVVVKMFTRVLTIDSSATVLNEGFTILDGLDYWFGGTRTVSYYVQNALAAMAKTVLDDNTKDIINDVATTIENIRLINVARNGGDDFTYDDGTSHTINSSSTEMEIKAAIDFQIFELNL